MVSTAGDELVAQNHFAPHVKNRSAIDLGVPQVCGLFVRTSEIRERCPESSHSGIGSPRIYKRGSRHPREMEVSTTARISPEWCSGSSTKTEWIFLIWQIDPPILVTSEKKYGEPTQHRLSARSETSGYNRMQSSAIWGR